VIRACPSAHRGDGRRLFGGRPRGDRGHEQDEEIVERVRRFHDGRAVAVGAVGSVSSSASPKTTATAPGSQWTKSHPFQAAFIYVGAPSDAGWTHAHDVGRLAVQSYFGGRVQTMYRGRT